MTPSDTGDMWLTLREASKAFDVSLSTLHRRRRSGELEDVGAFKDGDSWKVPRQGLARLGFEELVPPVSPGQTTVEEALSELEGDTVPPRVLVTSPDTGADTVDSAELDGLREQLEEAQRRESEAQNRAAVAEAIAAERERIIKVQEHALRMLEPGAADRRPPPTREEAKEPAQSATPEKPGRKSWWRRIWS